MYRSLEEICKEAAATGCSFWELIQKDDCRERQIAQEESFVQLQRMYQAMKEADQDYDGTLHSRSGLVGTDGGKLEHYVEQEEPICGDFLGRVMEKAVKMGESNACMKRIVAAPTAGACGVVPAVFLHKSADKFPAPVRWQSRFPQTHYPCPDTSRSHTPCPDPGFFHTL